MPDPGPRREARPNILLGLSLLSHSPVLLTAGVGVGGGAGAGGGQEEKEEEGEGGEGVHGRCRCATRVEV